MHGLIWSFVFSITGHKVKIDIVKVFQQANW